MEDGSLVELTISSNENTQKSLDLWRGSGLVIYFLESSRNSENHGFGDVTRELMSKKEKKKKKREEPTKDLWEY